MSRRMHILPPTTPVRVILSTRTNQQYGHPYVPLWMWNSSCEVGLHGEDDGTDEQRNAGKTHEEHHDDARIRACVRHGKPQEVCGYDSSEPQSYQTPHRCRCPRDNSQLIGSLPPPILPREIRLSRQFPCSGSKPYICALSPGGRCITFDETCLDGGARWNDCRMQSGVSCEIGGRLASRSGR
jgi:hypothetical protein